MKTFSFLLLFVPAAALSQGTLADYRRAETADTSYVNKVYNVPVEWSWLKNEHRLWYSSRTSQGREFTLVDVARKTKTRAFDHARLATALSQKLARPIKPFDLPFNRIEFEGNSVKFTSDSITWTCNLSNYELKAGPRLKWSKRRYWGDRFDETTNPPVKSPDSIWVAFIRNANVYVRNRKTSEEFRLSHDGADGEPYSTYMQWSPDSKKLLAYKVRPGENRLIWFVESSPTSQLQPKLHSREYRKPGDALPIKMPQLFLIDEKKHVPIPIDQFSQQYNIIDVNWRKDSRAFTFEYNARGHQRYKVIEVASPSGQVRVIIDEQPKTFFDYASKAFREDIDDGKEIIWMSERDGWNHLYLYDGATGQVKNQITKGAWPVRFVEFVDHAARQIVFAASGMDEGMNPYLKGYYRINFDGTGLTRLTPPGLDHTADFSTDNKYFFDVASSTTQPHITSIYSAADGKQVMELAKADPSGLYARGWQKPEPFTAKGRDGQTDIWGFIIKPSNFDATRRYPVIEYIYAGPHSSHVPVVFNSGFRSWHPLTELGFIVVQIDGMGTSNRSKAFHDVSWKNLKDAGFPDRILWIKEAAKTRPWMDLDRVGIFGNSAGGQNAMGALLFHPEFYKVAVASSGCHDNRMDKIWWNELWMSYPVGPHYAESSNVVNAGKLQGKLMLILGELDDNVDPASTMQVVDALVKAKKNFDFLFVPGMGHSLGGEYGERKRRDFFVKHLMGVEPPSWELRYGPGMTASGK
jgi:dipeptidyl aminopeptidase/acylaminoacyl peptidase